MPVERAAGGASLIDVLDRILDKSIVIDAWIPVSLVGIDLITVEARVVVASIDTYPRHADALWITRAIPRPPARPATRELLGELGFESFIVAPLRGSGEPAIGVVLLSKGAPASDADVQALAPFASQAGSLLAQARNVAELRLGGEAHAAEKEWLWWMVNAFADPVVVADEQNELVLANRSAELLFRSDKDDSAGKAHAISMNNFLFTAALSTWNLQSASERTRELTLVDPIEGDELIFEVITSPAINYRIGARGTVSVLKNVTDLRRVTEELSANIQRLQSADQEIRLERARLDLGLRNVPNPILAVDNLNEIVRRNAG